MNTMNAYRLRSLGLPGVVLLATALGACSGGEVGEPAAGQELAMADRGFFQPTGDTAMICYEARAVRGSGEPYRALVGTLYVLGEDGWKMAFHSQAPLADGSG